MTIRFNCKHCGTGYGAPLEKSGQSFACRVCNNRIEIPAQGGSLPENEPTASPIQAIKKTNQKKATVKRKAHLESEPTKRYNKTRKSPLTLIAIGVLAIAIALTAACAFVYYKRSATTPDDAAAEQLAEEATTSEIIEKLQRNKLVLASIRSRALREFDSEAYILEVEYSDKKTTRVLLLEFDSIDAAAGYERFRKLQLPNQIGFNNQEAELDRIFYNTRYRFSRWYFAEMNGSTEEFSWYKSPAIEKIKMELAK